MKEVWIRAAVYAALAALLAEIALLEAEHFAAHERFSEGRYVELTQSAILALLAVIMAIGDRRHPDSRPLFRCMAIGFLILFIRENDQPLELFLPHGAWKWPAALLAAWLLAEVSRHWQALVAAIRERADTLAFGVLLAGFATLVFSRFFGRGTFWRAVMEERYWRPIKNAAEEGVELFALGIIFAGGVELLLRERRRREA